MAGTIGVLFGGPSPEHDVSVLTGLLAAHELISARGKGAVRGVYWSKNGAFFEVDPALEAAAFADGPPKAATPLELHLGGDPGFSARRGRIGSARETLALDVVVCCTHGGPGEDGTLQGALDLAGVAYTGPSAIGAALGMDKLATAGLARGAGIEVLERLPLLAGSEAPSFVGPYIVKPRFGGSSIGIDVVADFETARLRLGANVHLRKGAVIEPYRDDLFDLQVAVRSFPTYELSAIERPLKQRHDAEILDYLDKYVGGEGMHAAPRELPAVIDEKLAQRLRETALRAAAVFQVRGIARIDFLSDGAEVLYLNEINTIPGSLGRHLFVEPARSFSELLEAMIAEAESGPSATYFSAGADGTVLRSAGSIASKLG